ncbi:MAG: hypothetical protein AAFU64_13130 [Bacteroidota bacterium]
MEFEKEYLISLVNGETEVASPPFSSQDGEASEPYLRKLVGRLSDIKSIVLKADFDHYGSGFSSYVHLYLSKKDKSDVKVVEEAPYIRESIHGLMIYLCRLLPFAVYSEGIWTNTYQDGKWKGGSSHYIGADKVGRLPPYDWTQELAEIKEILHQFGIRFLTKEELNQALDFEISIPTNFSAPPYQVFDCFFYWED